jgi:FixJ family two-component response regulator
MQATSDLPQTEHFSDLTSEELVRRLRERQRAAAKIFASLTLRERQVLQMVTTGLPNKAVANQLNLSIKTVEKHRGSLMRKLRLKSVCDLLQFWFTLTWDRSLNAD